MEEFSVWLRHKHEEDPNNQGSGGVNSRSLSSWSILGHRYTKAIETSNWKTNSSTK